MRVNRERDEGLPAEWTCHHCGCCKEGRPQVRTPDLHTSLSLRLRLSLAVLCEGQESSYERDCFYYIIVQIYDVWLH